MNAICHDSGAVARAKLWRDARVTKSIAILAVLAMGGCASVLGVAARGRLADYALEGPVDHELARDYLEGRALPPALEEVRDSHLASGEVPPRAVLARLAREYSPDVATLLFLETMSARPDVRELRERYEAELAFVRRVGLERARPDVPRDLLGLMVPGWSEGFDIDGLVSMRASQLRRAFGELRFPEHVRVVSLIAVPLSSRTSSRGTSGYALMRGLGPNDGLTLFSDELIPGAVPLLLPGVDHFLGPDGQRIWSTAIFRVLARDISPQPEQ
jgi:hypothetical protein